MTHSALVYIKKLPEPVSARTIPFKTILHPFWGEEKRAHRETERHSFHCRQKTLQSGVEGCKVRVVRGAAIGHQFESASAVNGGPWVGVCLALEVGRAAGTS